MPITSLGQLKVAAAKAEKAILRNNIYRESTFERLVELENAINAICRSVQKKAEEVIKEAGIKEPFQLLNESIEYWDRKLNPSDLPSESELIKRLEQDFKVKVLKAPKAFIPTDELNFEPEEEERSAENNAADVNRVAMVLETLLHFTIDGNPVRLDDLEIITSETATGRSRRRPYWAIKMLDYNVAVLVNNQAENRTFVLEFESGDDLERVVMLTKQKIKDEGERGRSVDHFKYFDESQFRQSLEQAIRNVIAKKKIFKMDESYFNNPGTIRQDLEAFSRASGLKTLEGLTVNMMAQLRVQCASGETVRGFTYLTRAGLALGLAQKVVDMSDKKVEVLKELKRKIGIVEKEYPKMDDVYFGNVSNIREDLRRICVALKLGSIEELTVNRMASRDVEFSNGETIKGSTYVSRAAKAFGVIETGKYESKAEVLKLLMQKINVEVKEYPPMDREYFETHMAHEFEELRKAAGLGSLEDLNTANFVVFIECSNGERVNGRNYVCRAAVALGLAKNHPEAVSRLSSILIRLKRKLGLQVEEKQTYPQMDGTYFSSEDNIRNDLNAYREILDLESVEQLTTNSLENARVRCCNGEEVRGGVYITRAGKALNLAENNKKARKNGAIILKMLKQKIGLAVEGDLAIYPEMDANYFTPENVRTDLEKFAVISGCGSVEMLNTANIQKSNQKAVCANGEAVTGQTYVYRAGKALGFGKTGRKAHSQMGSTLNALKKMIGIEVEEIPSYPEMDVQYFSDENISRDLENFAASMQLPSIEGLKSHNIHNAKTICGNGETVTGPTYAKRARRILGMDPPENPAKSNVGINRALEELIIRAKRFKQKESTPSAPPQPQQP